MTSKEKKELIKKVAMIMKDDVPKGLEKLAEEYWPKNVVPIVNGKHKRNIHEYLTNEFLHEYSLRASQGEHQRVYGSIKNVIVHVMNVRWEAYE